MPAAVAACAACMAEKLRGREKKGDGAGAELVEGLAAEAMIDVFSMFRHTPIHYLSKR